MVVTGGSSGIGRCAAAALLEQGARVTVLARESPAMDELRALPPRPGGRRPAVVTADVSDKQQVVAALREAREQHGPVGALITCAGRGGAGYFTAHDDDEFARQMAVNYFGTLHPIRACLDDLRATRGSITCVLSVVAFLGVFGYSAYAPSKYAVRGLTEVLRSELRPLGITVTAVYPPDVDTPMLAAEQPQKPAELRALSSGERALSPEAVATALLKATAAGRSSVYPGAATPALRWLSATAPRLTAKLIDVITDRAAAS